MFLAKGSFLSEIFGSSKNPAKLGLTTKGTISMAIPFVIHLLRSAIGIDVDAGLLQVLVDNILLFVQQATALIATGTIIVGLLRKLYYIIRPKKDK